MDPKLRVLALGWGLQSFTVAAMSALRELPKMDYAIHCDTTFEMQHTYAFAAKWTPWLEEHGIKVLTVRAVTEPKPVYQSAKSNGRYALMPAFTLDQQGNQGRTRRQCTGRWKIDPSDKAVNQLMQQLQIQKVPDAVHKYIGISYDEWQRMRTSDVRYVTSVHPLVDKRMTRKDCELWLQDHGIEVPQPSACTFCPFHDQQWWEEIKRAGGPDWEQAIAIDEAIRHARDDEDATKPIQLFVHRKRVPLREAVIIPEDLGMQQATMFAAQDEEELCDGGHCHV